MAMSPKKVAILGTLDTKGEEFAYLREQIELAGVSTLVIDAGVLGEPTFPPDIGREEVSLAGGRQLRDLLAEQDRGRSVTTMAAGAAVVVRRLYDEGTIHGLISLGGSAGTTIGTAKGYQAVDGPFVVKAPNYHGLISLGGSAGTTIGTAAMRTPQGIS